MKVVTIFFALLFTLHSVAQDLDTFFAKTDAFLKTHVAEGKVAYKTIYKDQRQLNAILALAASIKIDVLNGEKYQAFWINAYNIAVIKGVIDNYPIKSPLDTQGFFDKTTFNLGGENVTLNTIENSLLRANFKDPRFHFVLVCGAVGCPPLIAAAYMPNTLDHQLETQTKIALNGNFIKVNVKKKSVEVSEIMKWYKEDFTLNGLTEIDFINQYRIEKVSDKAKFSYFKYNWNLNKQ